MNWRIKGLIQNVLSVVPGGRQLNTILQWQIGGLRQFDRNVEIKVCDDWAVLVSHLHELNVPMAGRTFMEVGTGWYPTLPVCFALAGVSRCVTFDVSRMLDWRLTQRMLQCLLPLLPRIADAAGVEHGVVDSRWRQFSSADGLDRFLSLAGIEYHAAADACRTGLPDASVDVVFSNSVLEHVEPHVNGALMKETLRVLRPGGLAVHSVNCGDHYAYFDRSITQINYLRFSERQWRCWNNALQYQNRLRADDFVNSATDAGLQVVLNRQRPRPELLQNFSRFPIAPQFSRYSKEQLCTTSVDFAARAPVS
jgi:SAM-dependent methyltransferase